MLSGNPQLRWVGNPRSSQGVTDGGQQFFLSNRFPEASDDGGIPATERSVLAADRSQEDSHGFGSPPIFVNLSGQSQAVQGRAQNVGNQ